MKNKYFRGCISDSTPMYKELKTCENKISVPLHEHGSGYYCIALCKKIGKCPYQLDLNIITED